MKITTRVAPSLLAALASVAAIETTEDTEFRDLDITRWDCVNQGEGTAQSQEARERNRMKNRWPVDLSLFPVEPLDTAGFLKKTREYDSRVQSTHRAEMSATQKDELDKYENQIVSLTGWLVLTYPGPTESTNCASTTFHDWHLEIYENASEHVPQVGDSTPIICEVTPRTEPNVYRTGARIESMTAFLRLRDMSYRPTTHKARRVRVTGYLMWDDEHNGIADVGPNIEYFSKNGFHHPWRSTAWEIHPVMKIEVMP